jgi:hypothetical protein
MIRVLWELPFPSSGAVDAGFRELDGRDCAVVFKNTLRDGRDNSLALVFTGVKAFKGTYFHAISGLDEAYDTLVDLGETEWLAEVKTRLASHGDDTSGVLHLMILFDDGPCFEFICTAFSVEQPARTVAMS